MEWLFGKQTECSALGWDRPTTGGADDGVVESAASRTVRATTPCTDIPNVCSPPRRTERGQSADGFSPTRPLHADGIRIEPPPSLAPAAERYRRPPPHLTRPTNLRAWPGFQGLRAGPNSVGSVIPSPRTPGVGLAEDHQPGVEETPGDVCVFGDGSFDSDREPHEVGYP